MFEQRVATDEDARQPRGLWVPEGFTPEDVEPSDWYVVVDDLFDDVAVLAYVRWPRLDAVGRLYFGTAAGEVASSTAIPAPELQELVNAHRTARNPDPEVAARPLRIGDAFLVRGDADDAGFPDPESWELVVDVTSQARTAAKTALYGAVAPRVTEQDAAGLALVRTEDDERPPDPPVTGPDSAAPAV